MKRQLSIVVSVLVLVAMVFSLAACNTPAEEQKHEHTYGDTWSSDATSHWKTANCADNDECKSAIADFAAHTIEGDTCTTCGYKQKTVTVQHVHTFSNSWTKNETHHWHAAYCTGTDECATVKKDEAEHAYVDGKCVCGQEAPVVDTIFATTGENYGVIVIELKEGNLATITYKNMFMPGAEPTVYDWYYAIGENGIATFTDATGASVNDGPATYSLTFVDGVPVAIEWEAWEMELVPARLATDSNPDDGDDDIGDDDDDDIPLLYDFDEEQVVEITDADIEAGKLTFKFYPSHSGEYDFWYYFSGDVAVSLNGETVSRNDNGYFELAYDEEYTNYYIVEFIFDEYTTVGETSVQPAFRYPEGAFQNPNWLGSDSLGTAITATYTGNGEFAEIYYMYVPDADGILTLTTANENVRLVIRSALSRYEGVANFDEDGIWSASVSMSVKAGAIYYVSAVDNNYGEESFDIVFTATQTTEEYVGNGTKNLPYVLVLGENTVTVPAGDSVYYVFVADSECVLNVTSESELFAGVSFYYKNGNYIDGAVELWEGDIVYIQIDSQDMFNDASFTVVASIGGDDDEGGDGNDEPTEEYYTGTIANDGTPNAITVAENTWLVIGTMPGLYTVTWDNPAAILLFKEAANMPGMPGALTNGAVINYGMMAYLAVQFDDYAAGTVNVTFTPYVVEPTDLVVGDNTVSIIDTNNGSPVNLPVSDAEVTYVITPGADAILFVNEEAFYGSDEETVEITVPANTEVSFNVLAYLAGDVTVNVAVATPVEPTEVADSFRDLGANEFAIEKNTYLVLTIPASGLFKLTWDAENVVVEFKEAAMAPFTAIESGYVASVSSRLGSALKVYFTDYAAGTVTLTVAEYTPDPVNVVVGNNTINVIAGIDEGMVANLPVVAYPMTYVITPGEGAIIITADGSVYYGDDGDSVEIAVAANETVSFNVGAFTPGDVTVNVSAPSLSVGANTIAVDENGKAFAFKPAKEAKYIFVGEGVEVKVYDKNGDLVNAETNFKTSNTYAVVVTAAEEGECELNVYMLVPKTNNEISSTVQTYAYVVKENGVLNLATAAIMGNGTVSVEYAVNGGEKQYITAAQTSVDIPVVAGDIVVITMSSTTYSSLSVKFYIPPTEVAGQLQNIGDNEITLGENTYVVIPLRASGTYVLTWNNSNAVVEFKASADASFAAITNGAVATLDPMAGAALKIYLNGYAAGTVTLTVAEKTEQEEEGSESTSIDGTYIGAGTNSRGMMVVIDTAADTLVIIRAQSGSLTDFEGGSTYTLVYSETLAKADANGLVSPVSGTNMSSITFDENGLVKSIVWSAVVYSDFVKQ